MNTGTVNGLILRKALALSQTMQAARIYSCIFQRLYQPDTSL